jgi:AraC-like DNA-binding protein
VTPIPRVLEVLACGVAEYLPATAIGPRVLVDHELVLITAGAATWIIGGDRHAIRAGDVAVVPPELVEEWRFDGGEGCRMVYAHFVADRRLPPLVRRSEGHLVPEVMRHVAALAARPTARSQRVACAGAQYLLAALAEGMVATIEDPLRPLPAPLQRAFAQVRQRWTGGLRPIPAAELARAGGVSREHLSRLFLAQFGVAPAAALRLLRLERALQWITAGGVDIAQAARRAGWRDAAAFSAAMRAAFGGSPRALRSAWARGGSVRNRSLVRARELAAHAGL